MEMKIIILCGILALAAILLGLFRLRWLRKCYNKAQAEKKDVLEREQMARADKLLKTYDKSRSATWKSMGIAVAVFVILGGAVWGIGRIAQAHKAEKKQAKVEKQVKPETEVSLSLFGWFTSRFSYDKALAYHTEKVYSAKEKALTKYKEGEKILQSAQEQGNAKAESIATTKLVEAKLDLDEAEEKVKEIPMFYAKWENNSILNCVNIILFLYGILLLFAIKFSEHEGVLVLVVIVSALLCVGAFVFLLFCIGLTCQIFTWRTFLLILLLGTDIYLLTKVKWENLP